MKILTVMRNIAINLAIQLLSLPKGFSRLILRLWEEIRANLGDSKLLLSQAFKELGKAGMTLCFAALILPEKASASSLVMAFSISLAVWVVGFTLRKKPSANDSAPSYK